jgi:hypothetical protein
MEPNVLQEGWEFSASQPPYSVKASEDPLLPLSGMDGRSRVKKTRNLWPSAAGMRASTASRNRARKATQGPVPQSTDFLLSPLLSTAPEFMMYRKFQHLRCRALLEIQQQLDSAEAELLEVDRKGTKTCAEPGHSVGKGKSVASEDGEESSTSNPCCRSKMEVLQHIEDLFSRYGTKPFAIRQSDSSLTFWQISFSYRPARSATFGLLT